MRYWSILFGISLVLAATRIEKWREELDRAQTRKDLQALRKKIDKKRYKLAPDDAETAQLFLDVIDRSLVRKPYEEDLAQYRLK